MSGSCCAPRGRGDNHERPEPTTAARSFHGQVMVPAGTFAMGDAFDEGYPDDGETPVHTVTLPAFALDATAVSNADFAAFVEATGHRTDAEELGVSPVFEAAYAGPAEHVLGRVEGVPWWLIVRGADWRHPHGSASVAPPDHPVVQVSWHDATAYAAWAGKRLPTEAEWEYAARAGREGRRFGWGDELTPDGDWRCNIWQGDFPVDNTMADGFLTTSPVRTYEPNDFGLWQLTGNVWEWCVDWFDPTYYSRSATTSPRGPEHGDRRVMRGGSYLCHDSYCHRYRVAARSGNTPDSASANQGFRCANDLSPLDLAGLSAAG